MDEITTVTYFGDYRTEIFVTRNGNKAKCVHVSVIELKTERIAHQSTVEIIDLEEKQPASFPFSR
jgi:hypothetical protein